MAPIFLYLKDAEGNWLGHFHAITSIAAFLGKRNFCYDCMKTYDRMHKTCPAKKQRKECRTCGREDCEEQMSVKCPLCNLSFKNPYFYQKHLERGPDSDKKKKTGILVSVTLQVREGMNLFNPFHLSLSIMHRLENLFLFQCEQILDRKKHDPKTHKCYQRTCTYCLKSVDERHHLCYVCAQDPLGEKLEKFKFLFFNFETMQDAFTFSCDKGYAPMANPNCSACGSFAIKCKDCLRCKNCGEARYGSYEHEPNLVIVHSVCHHCFEEGGDIATAKCLECGFRCDTCSRTKNGWCAECGRREKVIARQFCTRRLFELIFVKRNRDAKVVAHNGKGFDFHFIMKEMLANRNCLEVIYAGSKIMSMRDHALNIQFLDSLNYLPMKLSQLPKAFGLDDGLAKGFFPHYFNTRPNQSYKGLYPSPAFYGHDNMSTSE